MEDHFLKQIENDDVFRTFMDSEFDAKTHATRIIQSHAISQQLAKLAEGINLLDKELHSQVVAHHEDLLSQATGIETLDGVLHMMQTRIQSLMLAIERIRTRVVEPYNKIVTRTTQLRRLQETCDLLRHIIRVMYLSKRLHGQLQGGTREITKAAQSLNELDYLSSAVDLSGIEVVEADRRFIKQARREVELQAQKMLEMGMEMQNQTQVATALQVFYNLSSLETTVDHILKSCKQRLHDNIKTALDVNILTYQPPDRKGGAPGRASGISSTGNTASFRATLWTNMEKLADNIYSSYSQMLHLQKVLIRKRDPVTHVLFIDLISSSKDGGVGSLLQDLWKFITATLADEFNRTADSNTFLRQALEGEYPKLVRLFNDLWRRIQLLGGATVDMVTGGSTPSTPSPDDSVSLDLENPELAAQVALDADYDPEKALRDTLLQFETAYLSRSLSRLIDPINLVFSSSAANPPTDDEIEGIVKVIASELSVANVDNKLAVTMARNVAKTIVFFCTKSEQLLVTDGEACQVIGPPSSAQTINAAIVNSLFKLHHAVTKVLSAQSGLPESAVQSFHESLKNVVELMGTAIQPLLAEIGNAIERIILTMHDEDFSQSLPVDGSAEPQCSLYMKELQQFVSRVALTYLAQFACVDFITQSVRPIACRCVELFIRHTSLICPLGEGGKLRLAADYAQLEMAISPLCNKVSDLGRYYRLVRAIRPLLFQSSETLSKSSSIGDVVPHSLAIHFLFARAHPTIKPPYQASGWTCVKYSEWLDEHQTEKDRLKYIKGGLEAYVQGVTSRGGKEFAPVYPIMLDLLQRGLQQHE